MAGRIPQRFIDDLLARVDIVEVIDSRVPLKKKGKDYLACCPFHNEKTPSFSVSPDKQFYHCFGCGAHGTALGFLMEYERLEFPDAVETLAHNVGLEVPREAGGPHDAHADLYEILDQAARFYRKILREHPPAIDYLKGRGISGRIAADYGLGFAPPAWDALIRHRGAGAAIERLSQAGLVVQQGQKIYDRFRNRIMFPIRDRRGRTIGFGGRVIDETTPKYMNSPETALFHKGRALYGLFEARQAAVDLKRVLLVEGYMDVVALAEHGIRNALATLGTATTTEHLQQVFRLSQEVVFCFDGDVAGREAAWRALQNLLPVFRDGLEARFLFLPEGQDPDSFVRDRGAEALMDQVGMAMPLADFLFTRLEGEIGSDTVAARARLAQQARPLLEKLPAGVFRELMFKRLAERVGINPEKLLLSTPLSPVKPRGPFRRFSLVRMAIALLLNRPALGQQAPDPRLLKNLNLKGIPLLVELLETLRAHPHLKPAALIERYRGSEYESHLLKLMDWRPPEADDQSLARLFDDVMTGLNRKTSEQRAEQLLTKARDLGLNEVERAELRALFTRSASD